MRLLPESAENETVALPRLVAGFALGAAGFIVAGWLQMHAATTYFIIPAISTFLGALLTGGGWPTALAGLLPLAALPVLGPAPLGRPVDYVEVGIAALCVIAVSSLLGRSQRERQRLVRRERALAHSESQYRTLLEASSDTILLFCPEGRLELVSGRSENFLDRTRAQLLGLTAGEIFGDIGNQIRESAARGELVSAPTTLKRRNGSSFRAELSANQLPDERLQVVVHDVTARKDTEDALRAVAASEERLRRITDAIPGTVYQFVRSPNGDQRFEFVSGGLRELFHIEPQQAIENFASVWAYVVPEDRARVAHAIDSVYASVAPLSIEFQFQPPGSKRRWVRSSSVPEPPLADGSIRWNGILLDITEEKRLETEFLQVQKMESIGRLAGGIAHDFNNILTAIRGNVDLLLEDVGDHHEYTQELRDIRDAAERASVLTRQLLAFSRKEGMQTRDLDVGLLVRNVEKMLRRVIGEDIVLLTQPIDSGAIVRADPSQLEQGLLNLAVNARDAMPAGGLLAIEVRNVKLDQEDATKLGTTAGDFVSVVVRDTGQGMTEDTKRHIFEPFFTTKPVGKGTGLGLTMVYGLTRQIGGAITVDSAPERGTTFRLFLPRVSEQARANVPIVTPNSVPVTPPRAANVLLVEDDPAVRALTKRILQDAGYSVQDAADAYEALTLAGERCSHLDVVVSDVIMPGMGGRDLANELRSRRHNVNILFISGYLDADMHKLGLDQRTRLLPKPFTRDALLKNVYQLIDSEESPASAMS